MSDTSTTTVERMAVSMEREIRRITKIDDLKANEAEMLRDLAKERDAARAEIERLTKLVSDGEKERYRACGELLTRAEKAEAELATCQQEAVTEAAQVIQTQGVEMTASAMILHIAEVLRENGGAVLSAKPGNDFGSQVLEFAAALRALKGSDNDAA